MYVKVLVVLIVAFAAVSAQPGKCDHTPPQAKVLTPSDNKGVYHLSIVTKDKETRNYLPDQTYVLILKTTDMNRPFRGFMITAEDPDVDNSPYKFEHKNVDVGVLKTLDTDRQSRYSEKCFSSVENTDNSDKYTVEVHWVSPKQSLNQQRIRLRAMIEENEEVWYTGENLTIILEKNSKKSPDSPPLAPTSSCNQCSEARYEVIFKGHWSRMSHPNHYPTKPDDNGFTYVIGASHDINFVLWAQGQPASKGLKELVEDGNVTSIEQDILKNVSELGGTRTLIRGKRRHHPNMLKPSHSLFRVDRIHHLFSVVVAMRPSPDWFLGTSRFELCDEDGWLPHYEIPLYPWDAGTMDGISYESERTMTQPVDNVERVAVGSFDRNSPFYQMNLNDLKPFAHLEVRRLDVYPLVGETCNNENEAKTPENAEMPNEEQEEPKVAEFRINEADDNCEPIWGPWSPCIPNEGTCGDGIQTRVRVEDLTVFDHNNNPDQTRGTANNNCKDDTSTSWKQEQNCLVDCY